MLKKLLPLLFAALLAGNALGAEPPEAAAVPDILWRVEFFDLNHASLGTAEMHITADHAKSCYGEIGADGRRVEFLGTGELSSRLRLAAYGVASFDEGEIKLDLTGGVCDAYLLMEGTLDSEWSSMGGLHTVSPGGEHDLGTYRAVRIAAPSKHAADKAR